MAERIIISSHLSKQSDINNFSRLNIMKHYAFLRVRFMLLCAKIAKSLSYFQGNMTTGL